MTEFFIYFLHSGAVCNFVLSLKHVLSSASHLVIIRENINLNIVKVKMYIFYIEINKIDRD